MRGISLPLSFALVLVLAGGPVVARDDPGPPPGRDEVLGAVRRSLGWLDRQVRRLPEVQGTPRKPFTVAAAGLARLMAGSEGGAGTGGDLVSHAKRYLLAYIERVEGRSRDPEQLPTRHGRFSSEQLNQYTWPLAQAGIFFAELYCRGRYREESRQAMRRIVRLLDEAREANGGWGHGRIRAASPTEAREGGIFGNGGYPSTLLAATNCVATSLGIVEATLGRGTVRALDRTRTYYREARLDNGNFPYDPSQRSAGRSRNGVSRTGGALMAMHFLGFPHSDRDLRGSMAFLMMHLDYASEGHGSATLNLSHCALALDALDEIAFDRFRAMYFPRILAGQAEDGGFTCICEGKAFGTSCDGPGEGDLQVFAAGGRAYVTALHTFILLLGRDRLKVLERKPLPAPSRGEATKEPVRKR